MRTKNIFLLLLIACTSPFLCYAPTTTEDAHVSQEIAEPAESVSTTDDECADIEHESENEIQHVQSLVSFNYNNESIVNIINHLASLKNVNVMMPLPKSADALNVNVTLSIPHKLTVDQAWDLVITLLDIAGYSTVPQGSLIKIIKASREKEMFREPLPTYIGVDPAQLPDNDQHIRYVYYLKNMRVSDEENNELITILKNILPENALIKADVSTNGLIIATKSDCIRAAIKIVDQLDQAGFQEKLDIMPLRHTSAAIVADLFNKEILKTENVNPYRLDAKKTKEVPYFSNFTKIFPEVRTNKLIILGRHQAIDRLKDFIQKYIDTEPESGKSILHVYQLQYLSAVEFAPTLEAIVRSQNSGSGQTTTSTGQQGGPERFFEHVVIKADTTGAQASTGLAYYGTNKLIVAARTEDWKQIRKLIEELDTPQPQVLIEILVADLSAVDTRALGTEMRFPAKIPLPDNMAFQSAQLATPAIATPQPVAPDTTLNSDLLTTFTLNGVSSTNLANLATPGVTAISFNDNNGETWSLLEILQLFNNSKIISHPHVVTTHNSQAIVEVGQLRNLPDDASGATGGTTSVAQKWIDASLKVTITPRITGNIVNLQIEIMVNNYLAIPNINTQNARTQRALVTNANVKSGGIFALGGLTQTTTTRAVTQFPILGKIPLLGWFFKSEQDTVVKNNLTIFITPTIIQPRLRGGIGDYTADYIEHAKSYSGGSLFTNLKDPITHYFFKKPTPTEDILDNFALQDELLLPEHREEKERERKKREKRQKQKKDTAAPETIVASVDINTDLPDLKSLLEHENNPFIRA